MPDFIPRGDFALCTWSRGFSGALIAFGGEHGVSPQRAAQYAELHAVFDTALSVANNGETRSPANVRRKRAARAELVAYARKMSGIVKAHISFTDTTYVAFGLKQHRGGHRPSLHAPKSAPRLTVIEVVGPVARVRLGDPDHPSSNALARGAAFARIYLHVGDTPPQSRQEWGHAYHTTSRARFNLRLPASLPPGTRIWLTAHWNSATGGTSPACPAVGTYTVFAGAQVRGEGLRAAQRPAPYSSPVYSS